MFDAIIIDHMEFGHAVIMQTLSEEIPLLVVVSHEDIHPIQHKSNELLLEEIIAMYAHSIPILPFHPEFISGETKIFVTPNQNPTEGVTPLSQIEKIDSNKKHQESNLIFLGRPPTCLGLPNVFVQKNKKPALTGGWSFI
jgi:hypothetical protein